MRVGIFGKFLNDDCIEPINQFFKTVFDKCESILIYKPFFEQIKNKIALKKEVITFEKNEDIIGKIDYLFSIGGDGTLLETITIIRNSGIPIMGINTGRLGFLSSISKEEIPIALKDLFSKNFTVDTRVLISLESNKSILKDANFALNEFTIQKKDTSSMITINIHLDGEFLNSYWADGLIISTPTGSTGYSLSCGGPIVFPQSGNFVITPIASHNLNNRPIIVSDNSRIDISIEARTTNLLVTLDSRFETVDTNCKFTIKKAPFNINLIRLNNQTFTNTLRNKLMWGIDKRN